MRSWCSNSSKEVKKKSNMESIVGSLHRQCIRLGSPRRRGSDITSEKGSHSRVHSQSPSLSKKLSRCLSFGEMPQSQPLPLPGSHITQIAPTKSSHDRDSNTSLLKHLPKSEQVQVGAYAIVGEVNITSPSNSSDDSSDIDGPYDSRLLSPQTSDYENKSKSDTSSPSGSKKMAQVQSLFPNKKNSRKMLNNRTKSSSPKERPLNSKVSSLMIHHHVAFVGAPDNSISSHSRSQMSTFGHCSSLGYVHNSGHTSVGGETLCHLLWPQSRCSLECSPLPTPRMTSPCPNSRIHNGTVTPMHSPGGAQSDDGRKQSYPLPLPPVTVYSPTSVSTPLYSEGTSPRIPRSPGKTDNPPNPDSRWKKGRMLGRGTCGHVYLGFNSESGEMCAMKEVTLFYDDVKSRECAQQLGQEIALLSRLHHPNIVQYYGSETVDDKLYIYLEYVSGGSIYKILQDYGQLGEAALRSYTQQILSGLTYLHDKNTLHRDIKGANILVDPNGRVKLADFGMAKHITGPSCPLSFKGTPYWMAPEVVNNSSGCNLAVDIWSLGCTVLKMATTKPPWSQYEAVAALFKIGNSSELPEIPDNLSYECKDFVRQCLQRNPCYRLTAAQLLEHPFIKNSTSLERQVLNIEPGESIHALKNTVRSLDLVHSETPSCLNSSGALAHSRIPVRLYPNLELSPKSPMPDCRNGF